MSKHLVVVDDDDLSRRGLSELLADRPEIEVVGSLTHREALAWATEWSDVDVSIVDAADERLVGEQFPGVGVVDRIRRYRSPAETTVIVITRHFFDDAVRGRMRVANADFFYHRSEIQNVIRLHEVVLHPDRARAGVPPARDEALLRMGVTPSTHINAAVSFADVSGLSSALSARSGKPNRTWHRHRHAFNRVARLHPVNADGTAPLTEQRAPSLRQIERFLHWATQAKQRHL